MHRTKTFEEQRNAEKKRILFGVRKMMQSDYSMADDMAT